MEIIIGLSIVAAIWTVVGIICTRTRRKLDSGFKARLNPAPKKLSDEREVELFFDYKNMFKVN